MCYKLIIIFIQNFVFKLSNFVFLYFVLKDFLKLCLYSNFPISKNRFFQIKFLRFLFFFFILNFTIIIFKNYCLSSYFNFKHNFSFTKENYQYLTFHFTPYLQNLHIKYLYFLIILKIFFLIIIIKNFRNFKVQDGLVTNIIFCAIFLKENFQVCLGKFFKTFYYYNQYPLHLFCHLYLFCYKN